MSATASFSFPGDAEKSLTVQKGEGRVSDMILSLKAESMAFLTEFIGAEVEADKVDVFDDEGEDEEVKCAPLNKSHNPKKQKTKPA